MSNKYCLSLHLKHFIYLYISLTFCAPGIFCAIRVHCNNIGSGVLVLHTRTLAALCGQHVRLGAVRLAYRCVCIIIVIITIIIFIYDLFLPYLIADKGICLPTIILWMLFVYLEVGIRWKDSRHMPHLDLCRPFAAHW